MKDFFREFKAAAIQAPVIFFAPLLGAIQGTKKAWASQCEQMTIRSAKKLGIRRDIWLLVWGKFGAKPQPLYAATDRIGKMQCWKTAASAGLNIYL